MEYWTITESGFREHNGTVDGDVTTRVEEGEEGVRVLQRHTAHAPTEPDSYFLMLDVGSNLPPPLCEVCSNQLGDDKKRRPAFHTANSRCTKLEANSLS